MTNFQFLTIFEQMQEGISFDTLDLLENCLVCYSKKDTDSFQNHALIERSLSGEEMDTVEAMFQSRDRKPAFFFENKIDFNPFIFEIEKRQYKKGWEDSWMFYNSSELPPLDFSSIRKVDSGEMLEVFLNTFEQSFQKDDPQNPYGELGEYLPSSKTAWLKHHSTGRLEYYLAFQGSEPVATSMLNSYHGVGYISGVGSLRSVRGKGYGKLITLFAVNESIQRSNSVHSLATEEGTYPNEFYKRIGFQTKFRALGYVKG